MCSIREHWSSKCFFVNDTNCRVRHPRYIAWILIAWIISTINDLAFVVSLHSFTSFRALIIYCWHYFRTKSQILQIHRDTFISAQKKTWNRHTWWEFTVGVRVTVDASMMQGRGGRGVTVNMTSHSCNSNFKFRVSKFWSNSWKLKTFVF